MCRMLLLPCLCSMSDSGATCSSYHGRGIGDVGVLFQVVSVESSGAALTSITLRSKVGVGYTASGLNWYRHHGVVGVNIPLLYGLDRTTVRPWRGVGVTRPGGGDRTRHEAQTLAAELGADIMTAPNHFQTLLIRKGGQEEERTTLEWASTNRAADHNYLEESIAVRGGQVVDMEMAYRNDGHMCGEMVDIATGELVTVVAQHPAEIVAGSFENWSKLCLTR